MTHGSAGRLEDCGGISGAACGHDRECGATPSPSQATSAARSEGSECST